MLVSTPTKDYLAQRNLHRDSSMSPSYRYRNSTPPSHFSDTMTNFDSPMLTPSPLRQRPLFAPRIQHENDEPFLQSPYKSPAPAHQSSAHSAKLFSDDINGSLFPSSSGFSPFLPTSSSHPLLTPVKKVHRVLSRPVLSVLQLNTPVPNSSTRTGVGTKRKSGSYSLPTPSHPQTLTPLRVNSESNVAGGTSFDRLAPLPAPKFHACTPQSKAETETYLRRQTATLTKLKIADRNDSDNDSRLAYDSDGDLEDDADVYNNIFVQGNVRSGLGHLQRSDRAAGKAKDEEVVEAVSPDGHITKRRARSRPVSAELLNSAQGFPASPSPKKTSTLTFRSRLPVSGVAFPSAPSRKNASPSSRSSSEAGSPIPRRRTMGGASMVNREPPQPIRLVLDTQKVRRPLNRQDSVSSATLFFGPAIPPPNPRSRVTSVHSPSTGPSNSSYSRSNNRHSYAGGNSWRVVRSHTPSPTSSPARANPQTALDEEELFFGSNSTNTSFVFNLNEGTPSPASKRPASAALPRKYKARDSGIVVSDDDDSMQASGSFGGIFLNVMPRASHSVNSISSDAEDGLVTPVTGPELGSGWPGTALIVTPPDEPRAGRGTHSNEDAFILRTLTAAAANAPQEGTRKVPGTPVKKVKTSYLASERPWQSAVANKIDRDLVWDTKKEKVPRKSLPAVFSGFGKRTGKVVPDPSTDSEGEEDSPSHYRKDAYNGIGLGRPTPQAAGKLSVLPRTHWLTRRSSSGNFSSGTDSGSAACTPTRMKGSDWQLSIPRLSAQLSTRGADPKAISTRSSSNSSNSSVATLGSPTTRHHHATKPSLLPRASGNARRLSEISPEDQPGRFERDFVEVEEIGSGEFGKVIKVRSKIGLNKEVFAVKKSKRFEGARHRLRLWEEVEILKHLSQVAATTDGISRRHPNVLAYVDSWEEDEALYIQTELCESGNLARFLWEYGRVYPRLDEAKVWKIIVDLSNGLRFIHDAGVIHLDLKPSNIFLTGEGRFKIGDFGMASVWPRRASVTGEEGGFEREGDKLYLAPEVLQGKYGKAVDVFSFGMTMLETASNIVVPDQGEAWHRLRREDFSQVDLEDSPELLSLIHQMMRTDPSLRMTVHDICSHPIVSRARGIMEQVYLAAKQNGTSVFDASPLSSVPHGFLEEILDRSPDDHAMDISS